MRRSVLTYNHLVVDSSTEPSGAGQSHSG
jgi:hypothetical protein